jgi:hypothetical protein
LLPNDVHHAIQKKDQGNCQRKSSLLYVNARRETANFTNAKLAKIGWEIIDHPSSSPNLAPSDFYWNH